MNIQKIHKALDEDQDNSALGIICNQLEEQGYGVNIDGKPVSSRGFFNGEYSEIEKKLGSLRLSLIKRNNLEQEFVIEFTDFHKFVIKSVGQ